jgi:hypothetical protein
MDYSARRGENIVTYVESTPFNLHGFQHLLYRTFVYEITKGLPSTLVRSFVGRLGPESGG